MNEIGLQAKPQPQFTKPENKRTKKKKTKTNQPVSGGKANIHPTDPPPDVEPNIPSITELREPQK